MAFGIVVRDAAGNVILDPNERLAKMIDVFSTGTSSGSRSYDAGGGELCFIPVADYSVFFDGPSIRINGNTISWTFDGSAGHSTPQNIMVWSF